MYKHKFKAKPTTLDGIHFASKAEANYYTHLLYEKEKGNIVFFLRQVPFHLPGNTRYVVDFIEFWEDGTILFTDVKGVETETYKLKKRMVEELYPIRITVVKNGRKTN